MQCSLCCRLCDFLLQHVTYRIILEVIAESIGNGELAQRQYVHTKWLCYTKAIVLEGKHLLDVIAILISIKTIINYRYSLQTHASRIVRLTCNTCWKCALLASSRTGLFEFAVSKQQLCHAMHVNLVMGSSGGIVRHTMPLESVVATTATKRVFVLASLPKASLTS